MYSLVLLAALSAAEQAPACHRSCHGCYGCYGCYGCSGCYGCWGGCYGGCYGCAGCYGGYVSYGCCGTAINGKGGKGKDDGKMNDDDDDDTTPPDKEVRKGKATLLVKVPADAKLYVNDRMMKATSANRKFRTPSIDKGQLYYYMVRAEVVRDGKVQSETKRVELRAGQEVVAAFTLDAVASAK